MSHLTNPYTSNLLPYHAQAFFGHRDDINLFEKSAAGQPPRSFALVGPRNIGKTWLLRFLCDERREDPARPADLFSIYCDMRGTQEHSPIIVICEELSSHIDALTRAVPDCRGDLQAMKQALELLQSFSNATEAGERRTETLTQLRDRLRRICATVSRVTNVSLQFCLDHFGELLESIQNHDEVFLRELVTTTSFIVTIRPGFLEQHMVPQTQTSPFLNMMLLRRIGALTDSEARELIIEPLKREGLPADFFDDQEIRFLIETAGRHPLLLTLACDYYFSVRRQPGVAMNLNEQIVRDRLTQEFLAMPEVTRYCMTIWYELSPRHQRLLHRIAHGISESEIEPYRTSLKEIISRALLWEDVETSEYRLFSRVFERYVLGHKEPAVDEQSPGQFYDQVAARLKPIDGKLWNYLRKHPHQILSRQELLEHVWDKDDPSARGLEAAIYRIRSVLIAVGGGNWEYIRTIRGQGYKYIPRDD